MVDLQLLHNAILTGDSKATQSLVAAALAAGTSALDLLNSYMVPAMDEVGQLFESGEYFVPVT